MLHPFQPSIFHFKVEIEHKNFNPSAPFYSIMKKRALDIEIATSCFVQHMQDMPKLNYVVSKNKITNKSIFNF